jgi:hypothetical protein
VSRRFYGDITPARLGSATSFKTSLYKDFSQANSRLHKVRTLQLGDVLKFDGCYIESHVHVKKSYHLFIKTTVLSEIFHCNASVCFSTVRTGTVAHTTTCPVDTESYFPGVKRPGREAGQSPPFFVEVKNARRYNSTALYVQIACYLIRYRDNFIFTLSKTHLALHI